ICAQVASCGEESKSECMASYRAEANCDYADSVSDNYNGCMNAIGSMKCGDDERPAACNGVIVVSATGKCEAFIDKYCATVAGCGEISRSECMAAVRTVVFCDDAVSVGNSYNGCMNAIGSLKCGEYDLPASCNAVILVRK
ncbi:MAG: hypothetical protein FWD57_09355, partial [Polyangiaceae bacterium]|nr:hypothetical protein [Polyangiaceae bacterium]